MQGRYARLDLNVINLFLDHITIDEERQNINNMCQFTKQIATLCEFPNDKQSKGLQSN